MFFVKNWSFDFPHNSPAPMDVRTSERITDPSLETRVFIVANARTRGEGGLYHTSARTASKQEQTSNTSTYSYSNQASLILHPRIDLQHQKRQYKGTARDKQQRDIAIRHRTRTYPTSYREPRAPGTTSTRASRPSSGGVGALGSAREGRHCCVCINCSAARVLIIPELLFGIYTLLWLRRTLRTVELEAQITNRFAAGGRRRKGLREAGTPSSCMSNTHTDASGFHIVLWGLVVVALFMKLLDRACQASTPPTTVVRYVVADPAAARPEAGGSEAELAPLSSTRASEAELGMGGIEAGGVACSQ